MAKFKEKLRALEMRRGGESVKVIARELGVSKGTASIWCRDVKLTTEQIVLLNKRMTSGSYAVRMRAAGKLHSERLEREYFLELGAEEMLGELSRRDFLLLGLGLYIGEGHKKQGGVIFTNSDPVVIQSMIRWLREFWSIGVDRLTLWISINESHRARQEEVEQYWEKVTGIPRSQFQKTYFKQSVLKKVYENHLDHYGTVQIRVRKSKDMLSQILGMIRGSLHTAG